MTTLAAKRPAVDAMKYPPFVVLGILCFSGGWWIDEWLDEDGGNSPQVKAGTVSAPASPQGKTMPGGQPSTVQSVEELLRLIVPGRETATRTHLDPAVAGLSAGELAEFADSLKSLEKSTRGGYGKIHPALVAVVTRWLGVDPAPAAEFALNYPNRIIGDGDVYSAFLKAMQKVFLDDLPTATRLMAGMKSDDRELYIYARFECIEGLAGMDPEKALKIIADFDAKTRNQWHGAQALGDFPERWIKSDPNAAMDWALSLPPGYTRSRILTIMAEAWGKSDPAAVKAFLDAVPVSTLPKGNLRAEIAEKIRRMEAASAAAVH
jgi:hypothetical protein